MVVSFYSGKLSNVLFKRSRWGIMIIFFVEQSSFFLFNPGCYKKATLFYNQNYHNIQLQVWSDLYLVQSVVNDIWSFPFHIESVPFCLGNFFTRYRYPCLKIWIFSCNIDSFGLSLLFECCSLLFILLDELLLLCFWKSLLFFNSQLIFVHRKLFQEIKEFLFFLLLLATILKVLLCFFQQFE